MFVIQDASREDDVAAARAAILAARRRIAPYLADTSIAALDALLAEASRYADAILDDADDESNESDAGAAPMILPGACPICGTPGYDGVYCGYCNNGAF